MKIIISHDVDHLYNKDHLFRDLIFPKLIVRSFFHFLKGKITFKTFFNRVKSVFEKRLNRIDEVMEKDKNMGVPSTFFFGMAQGIGMSYKPNEAEDMIQKVRNNKFAVGVHGIDYQDIKKIKKEHDCFARVSGKQQFGIRTHYVRFDNDTFDKFEQTGYVFDTSEFNKNELEIKAPYKVGNLWEFPLHIMDGYIMPFGDVEKGKVNTIHAIEQAESKGMPYCTILYHDYQYNAKTYPDEKEWYDWLLNYLKGQNYEFISYEDAITELEA